MACIKIGVQNFVYLKLSSGWYVSTPTHPYSLRREEQSPRQVYQSNKWTLVIDEHGVKCQGILGFFIFERTDMHEISTEIERIMELFFCLFYFVFFCMMVFHFRIWQISYCKCKQKGYIKHAEKTSFRKEEAGGEWI